MNDVTLREYIEALLNEREKRTSQLERDAKEALAKASVALERRLDLLNEFRAQAADESAKYAQASDLRTLSNEVGLIRGDHVRREEFDQVRGTLSKMVGAMILMAAGLPILTGLIFHYIN